VRRTRLLRALITAVGLALAALPAVVVFGLGWLTLGRPDVPEGGTVPADTTSPAAWALFALFYFAWLFGLMVLVIWSFDRLGHHWRAWDRAPRRQKRRRRRLGAGLAFLAGQEKAQADAEAEIARRRSALAENQRRAAGGGPGAHGGSDRARASGRPEDR
jgi:hypothetical protein